jgi:hypothetical protein
MVGPPVVRDLQIFAPKFTDALAIHSLDVIPLTRENEERSREVGSGGSFLTRNRVFAGFWSQVGILICSMPF